MAKYRLVTTTDFRLMVVVDIGFDSRQAAEWNANKVNTLLDSREDLLEACQTALAWFQPHTERTPGLFMETEAVLRKAVEDCGGE